MSGLRLLLAQPITAPSLNQSLHPASTNHCTQPQPITAPSLTLGNSDDLSGAEQQQVIDELVVVQKLPWHPGVPTGVREHDSIDLYVKQGGAPNDDGFQCDVLLLELIQRSLQNKEPINGIKSLIIEIQKWKQLSKPDSCECISPRFWTLATCLASSTYQSVFLV